METDNRNYDSCRRFTRIGTDFHALSVVHNLLESWRMTWVKNCRRLSGDYGYYSLPGEQWSPWIDIAVFVRMREKKLLRFSCDVHWLILANRPHTSVVGTFANGEQTTLARPSVKRGCLDVAEVDREYSNRNNWYSVSNRAKRGGINVLDLLKQSIIKHAQLIKESFTSPTMKQKKYFPPVLTDTCQILF